MLSSKNANRILLATLGFYMGFAFVCAYLLPSGFAFLNELIAQLLLILPALICMARKKLDWKDVIAFNDLSGENTKMAIAAIAASYPCVVVLNLLSMTVTHNEVTDTMSYFFQIGLMPSLVMACFMPAFAEEFLCRGILYQSYRQSSRLLAVILSALAFGLFHMNLNQLPYAFFLGMIFALMVEATGSIMTSMIMHFSMNAFNLCLNFYLYASDPAAAMDTSATDSLLTFGMKDLVMMLVVFMIFFVMTMAIVDKTFRINGRSMREFFSFRGEGERQDFEVSISLLIYVVVTVFIICLRQIRLS